MALSPPPTIDRMALGIWPTPLVHAPELASRLNHNGRLLIKRDDLTGFAVAGNKTRAWEFLSAEARAMGADVLVTGGTEGSNFCQAAAAVAARLGLGCVLVYAGNPSRDGHPNVRAARAWGARLRWTGVDDRESVDVAIETVADELRLSGEHPYSVPRGGATPRGSLGYYFAAHELAGQYEGPLVSVMAVGSGGSIAGLLAGVAALDLPWRIVGASVSRPPDVVAERVFDLATRCADLMSTRRPDRADIHIHDARGTGHGRPSAAGDKAAQIALQSEGFVLDPVYTAKALGALKTITETYGDAATTVFWHTGGLLDAVHEWETR